MVDSGLGFLDEGSALRTSSSCRGRQEPRIRILDWCSRPQLFPFPSVRFPGKRIDHIVGVSFCTAVFGRNIFCCNKYTEWRQDSSVSVVTSYGAVVRGSNLCRDNCFSSPKRPDRLWGSPNLLFNGCRGVRLTTQLFLMPSS